LVLPTVAVATLSAVVEATDAVEKVEMLEATAASPACADVVKVEVGLPATSLKLVVEIADD